MVLSATQNSRPFPLITPGEYGSGRYAGAPGYTVLADGRNGGWRQRGYTGRELPEALQRCVGLPDQYLSTQTHFMPARRVDTVKRLTALFVDLDCYRLGMHPLTVLMLMETLYQSGKVPEPRWEIISGRGAYLIWPIVPERDGALPLWQSLQDYIHKQLRRFGADPAATDAARCLRVPGSFNSKNGGLVQCWERPFVDTYRLQDLVSRFLPVLAAPVAKPRKSGLPAPKKATAQSKVRRLFNEYTLSYARLRDLVRLAELREWHLTGHREMFCWLYRQFALSYVKDPEEALRQTLDFNGQFTEPLKVWEVRSSTANVERKSLYPTNARLIALLSITETEQQSLKTIISATEKNRRRRAKRRGADGLTRRQRTIADRMTTLHQALQANPDATQVELANTLEVTQQRVSQLLIQMK